MRATPMLVAAFIAAGCSYALAQAGAGSGAGAGAGSGAGASGAAAGTGAGASAGTSAGSTGATAGNATSAGADMRGTRTLGRFRRSDDMEPLVLPREEAPVRLYRRY